MNTDDDTSTATNISSNTHTNRTMSIRITMMTIAAAITTVNQADTSAATNTTATTAYHHIETQRHARRNDNIDGHHAHAGKPAHPYLMEVSE